MKNFLKIVNKIRDIIEIYVPMAAFLTMFLTFILQIIMRRVFNNPLTWAYEVTVIGFIWTVILGACYAQRYRAHVKFTLIYDMLSKEKAAIVRALGNLIIVVAFILLIVPSYKYVTFMSFQSTSVFKIKLSWIFMPFVYFLISISLYTIEEIVEDYKILRDYRRQLKESKI